MNKCLGVSEVSGFLTTFSLLMFFGVVVNPLLPEILECRGGGTVNFLGPSALAMKQRLLVLISPF